MTIPVSEESGGAGCPCGGRDQRIRRSGESLAVVTPSQATQPGLTQIGRAAWQSAGEDSSGNYPAGARLRPARGRRGAHGAALMAGTSRVRLWPGIMTRALHRGGGAGCDPAGHWQVNPGGQRGGNEQPEHGQSPEPITTQPAPTGQAAKAPPEAAHESRLAARVSCSGRLGGALGAGSSPLLPPGCRIMKEAHASRGSEYARLARPGSRALRGELDPAGAPGVASHLIGRDPGAPANPRPCP